MYLFMKGVVQDVITSKHENVSQIDIDIENTVFLIIILKKRKTVFRTLFVYCSFDYNGETIELNNVASNRLTK